MFEVSSDLAVLFGSSIQFLSVEELRKRAARLAHLIRIAMILMLLALC